MIYKFVLEQSPIPLGGGGLGGPPPIGDRVNIFAKLAQFLDLDMFGWTPISSSQGFNETDLFLKVYAESSKIFCLVARQI